MFTYAHYSSVLQSVMLIDEGIPDTFLSCVQGTTDFIEYDFLPAEKLTEMKTFNWFEFSKGDVV